jgi:hypothetical protein
MAGECELGVTGLATMGANLARNAARHGFPVAVHNRTLVAASAHPMPSMWARKRGSDQFALVWPSAVYQERPRPASTQRFSAACSRSELTQRGSQPCLGALRGRPSQGEPHLNEMPRGGSSSAGMVRWSLRRRLNSLLGSRMHCVGLSHRWAMRHRQNHSKRVMTAHAAAPIMQVAWS